MSKFQIILTVVFGVFIVLGVGVFALYRGGSASRVEVVVWGDVSSSDFSVMLHSTPLVQDKNTNISYVEKSPNTIEEEFTEALARGTGPDLIIITQDKFWKNKPKLLAIPYDTITERDFKNTFIEEGELFLDPTGIYALPLVVDPMVLYYNRDLLSAGGVSQPLRYWDEIYASSVNLSKRDAAGNLVSSIMALGESRNIPHAKDILSLLLLQAGTPITSMTPQGLRSVITDNFGLPISPAESALDFYTQFSNPTKVFYSWNRSLIDAQTHFTSGDSAYYLGFASELRTLRSKNPTLNFGVALVPQSRVSGKSVTYGRLKAIAISRGARSPGAALSVAMKLVSKDVATTLSQKMVLPPARRDLLATRPTDANISVFYDGALQAKGWIDPDTTLTGNIFRDAIESITSGRSRTAEALRKADNAVEDLIQ